MSNVTATTKEKPLVIYSRVNEDGVPKLLTFVNADGTPHDITVYDFEYLLKAKPGTPANIFRLSIGDGLMVQGSDNNQLLLEIDEDRASIRPLLYFGLLRSVTEDHTWLNVKHQFIDGSFDGVTETDTITIEEDGGSVLITITGIGSGTSIQFQNEGTNLGNNQADTVDFVGAGVTATRVADKITVTIPGGSGVSGVTSINGITTDNTDPTNPILRLGGSLNQNTDIDNLTNALNIGTGNGFTDLRTGGFVYWQSTAVEIGHNDTALSQHTSARFGNNSIEIKGATPATFGGAKYLNDYSANYTNRSLIDKGYADATYGFALTNGNGTTANGTAVDLGGTLNQITTIDIDGNLFIVGNPVGAYFEASAGTIGLATDFGSLNFYEGDNPGSFVFTDNRTLKEGIVYDATTATGADFVGASIINKSYADASYWSLSSGGTLTGANTITGTTTNILKYVFNSLGVTSTDGAGHWISNTTAAAAGAQQISPSLVLEGQGWKTTATAASQSVKWKLDVLPIQGTTNPTSALRFTSSINGAAYTSAMTLDATSGNSWVSASFHTISVSTSSTILTLAASGSSTGVISLSSNLVQRNRLLWNTIGTYFESTPFAFGTTPTAGIAFHISQPVATSGSPNILLLTGAAHTTLAASTEANDLNLNLARTVQFATGALTTQRAVRIQAPTYGFVAASTITTASTVSISGGPVAGTNATITNAYALNVESGVSNFGGNVRLTQTVTTEALVSDTSVTIVINGTTYKLLARA